MSEKKNRYTVKKVAEVSGVSERALRFYDEIGLLKPAFVGDNGYRYYEKEQLLLLQQILFYRELGFELAVIQKIIADPGFDKVTALRSHREQLEKESKRTVALIQTIDKTLAHLEKEIQMSDDEIYRGFDGKKQKQDEEYLVQRYGDPAEKNIAESKRRTKDWKKEDFDRVKQDYDLIHKEVTNAIETGLAANSIRVQTVIARHYSVVSQFWKPNREAYIGLGKLYCEHGDFRKLYEGYHPRLAEFLAEAMRVYAENELQ